MVLTESLLFRFITVFKKLYSLEMGQLLTPKIVDFDKSRFSCSMSLPMIYSDESWPKTLKKKHSFKKRLP